MKHTAFAFGFASLVAAGTVQPRHVSAGTLGDDDVGRARPRVVQPVLAEIEMPVTDVHAWVAPAPPSETNRTRRRREHARRHDAAVRAGLATLLAPAPGQQAISLQRPLLGRDLRPLSGNVMTRHSKGKTASPDWTDGE